MTNPNEELPVTDFFENDEAIGLLVQIDRQHGNIKGELEDRVDISGKTLKHLLEASENADLIEQAPIRSEDHGRAIRYQLTERGKAIQSLLRAKGLDDTHREYMSQKKELESVVPSIQSIVEDQGLHKEYVQQDFWIRSDFDSEELDREKLASELEQSEQKRTGSNQLKTPRPDNLTPDILSEGDDDEDIGTVETEESSEENSEDE